MKVIHKEADVKLKDVEAKCKDVEVKHEAGKRLWEVEKKAWEVERLSMIDQIEEVEDMTIATVGWVCGVDTKLIDCILLRHLLDLTQAKLAKLAQLTAPPGTNCATQSILWRDALGTTHIFAKRLQTAQKLLNRADT
ncbi:hypothetical protein BDR07DRAFT_1480363 [Suillus spraguei]|nr:hypothetical protein BDR07DRAFT_1480363 [Suillus spraguei]